MVLVTSRVIAVRVNSRVTTQKEPLHVFQFLERAHTQFLERQLMASFTALRQRLMLPMFYTLSISSRKVTCLFYGGHETIESMARDYASEKQRNQK